MVDQQREMGRKVGLLKVRAFSPFPRQQITEVLSGTKKVALIERSHSMGHGGHLAIETKAAMYDAGQGLKEQKDAFAALGVEVTDSEGRLRETTPVLLDLAKAMSAMEGDTLKVALAQKILGKSGVSLIPMLNQGEAALRAQLREARRGSPAARQAWRNRARRAAARRITRRAAPALQGY